MNYLWAFMILSGVIFSAFHGTIPAVTGAVLDSAKEAVTLCITMTGVMSFWMGLDADRRERRSDRRLSEVKTCLRFLFRRFHRSTLQMSRFAANMTQIFSDLAGQAYASRTEGNGKP